MKYAQCDNCGHKDDSNYGSGPILYEGAVIQLRRTGGGDEFEIELEICEGCRSELFTKFPKLKKSITK